MQKKEQINIDFYVSVLKIAVNISVLWIKSGTEDRSVPDKINSK